MISDDAPCEGHETLPPGLRQDEALGPEDGKLHTVMRLLIDGKPLPLKYRNHALQGEWQHVRDCHIEGDWILLYELGTDPDGTETVTFHATDNHEHLFG